MAPLVLGLRPAGRARLGGAAALVGDADVPRRRSGPAGCSSSSGSGRAGALAGRARLRVHPLPARVHGPHLRAPAAVGRRCRGSSGSPMRATRQRDWRAPAALGAGAPPGRRRSTRPRCCWSAWRPLLWVSSRLAPRAASGRCCARPAGSALVAVGRVAVVARRAPPPGALRAAGAPDHREPPHGRRAIVPRATCCAAWATGSSTDATPRGTPSTRRSPTTATASWWR